MPVPGDTAVCDVHKDGGTTGNAPPDPAQDPAAPGEAGDATTDRVDDAAADAVAAPDEAVGGTEFAGPSPPVRSEPLEVLHTR